MNLEAEKVIVKGESTVIKFRNNVLLGIIVSAFVTIIYMMYDLKESYKDLNILIKEQGEKIDVLNATTREQNASIKELQIKLNELDKDLQREKAVNSVLIPQIKREL